MERGGGAQRGHRGSVDLFGDPAELPIGPPEQEVLGQGYDPRAGGGGAGDEFERFLKVLILIGRSGQLDGGGAEDLAQEALPAFWT
jgi:hypothetical protein